MKNAGLLIALLLALTVLTSCTLQPVPELPSPVTQVAQQPAATAASTLNPTAVPEPTAISAPTPQSQNVALAGVGRSSEGEESAHLAFDGDLDTNWNAKNLPIQWTAVTLDDLYLVDRIELVVAQSPAGPTTHVLWLGNGSGVRTLYKRFSDAHTEDGQTLTVEFNPPRPIDDILVQTLESPSWVAWREVRVFGSPAPLTEEGIEAPQLNLVKVVEGLELPVQVTHSGDGSNRIFIVEQKGRVRTFKDGLESEQPFIDITPQVSCCGEKGLLNIVFSPDFQSNQQFYLSYTSHDGALVVSRFTAASDLETTNSASEEVLLAVSQPHRAHNGG